MCLYLRLLFVGIIYKCYFETALSVAWTARPVSSACQCTDVTLNWQYSGGHQASDIIWMKNFNVIFMYDGTKAIVIDNSFNGRLAYTTGASLTIYSLSTGDAGNYSVTVTFDISTNNLTDIVYLAVISLDNCRATGASVIYLPSVTADNFQGQPPSYTVAATTSAVLSIICSWYKNGVLVGSNNSLTVSKPVPGKECGWKSMYCYMCTVGNCGSQSELVCKSVDEYNCALGNPGIVFPSPPTGSADSVSTIMLSTTTETFLANGSTTPNTGASLQNATQVTSCIDVNQVNAFLAAETMMMAALLVGVLVLSKVIIGSIK